MSECHTGWGLPGTSAMWAPPWGQNRASQPGPNPQLQAGAGQLRDSRGSPSPRRRALSWARSQAGSGDGAKLGLGQDVGPWVGPAWRPRARLWGAEDGHCCGVAGAGTDSHRGLQWGPGPWAGCGEAPGQAEQGHHSCSCSQGLARKDQFNT